MASRFSGTSSTELGRAKACLLTWLANGPQRKHVIDAKARREGISGPTLRRAGNALGLRRWREGQVGTNEQRWVLELGAEVINPVTNHSPTVSRVIEDEPCPRGED
jgi:hypothetical protein